MGLDIYRYKLTNNTSEERTFFFNYNDEFDNHLLSEFKKYINEEYFYNSEEECYDFKKIGVSDNTHSFLYEDWPVNGRPYIKYADLTHELGTVYKHIYESIGFTTPFVIPESDSIILNKYNWNDIVSSKDIKDNTLYTPAEKHILYDFIVNIISRKLYYDDIPTCAEKGKKIYIKETGYQHRGLNTKWYEDHSSGIEYIFTKEKLQELYNTYVEDVSKEYFKKYILDPFVEGEEYILISW